jgi:hypothetical protein
VNEKYKKIHVIFMGGFIIISLIVNVVLGFVCSDYRTRDIESEIIREEYRRGFAEIGDCLDGAVDRIWTVQNAHSSIRETVSKIYQSIEIIEKTFGQIKVILDRYAE